MWRRPCGDKTIPYPITIKSGLFLYTLPVSAPVQKCISFDGNSDLYTIFYFQYFIK